MSSDLQGTQSSNLLDDILTWIKTSRYIVPFLFLLGVLRSAFLLLAYAPADGADGMKYYLYSAYISGISLHPLVSELSPLYPYFIYIHRYVLGNFDTILITQFLMSASLGVIYFLALKRYHTILALIISLVIIGDIQTGLSFNFTATEPLYIFLLATTFALSMQMQRDDSLRRGIVVAGLAGCTVALLTQTRTVATLIIVPIFILAAIHTRSWQQILSMLTAFGATLLLFIGLLASNGVEQDGSVNQIMIFNFLNRAGAFQTDVSDQSSGMSELQEIVSVCGDTTSSSTTLLNCMQEELGGSGNVNSVLQQAYLETATEQFSSFMSLMYENVTSFLKMSGHQLFEPERTPAQAQCEDVVARHERTMEFFATIWAGIELSDTEFEALESTTWDFTQQMCPPSKTISEFQRLAWYISFRYRSISRPNPYLWYGLLILLIFIVPRMRKLWYPIFMAGGLLVYHAVISAVALNVQPRYVSVTNPFKIILVVSLIILLVEQVIVLVRKRL